MPPKPCPASAAPAPGLVLGLVLGLVVSLALGVQAHAALPVAIPAPAQPPGAIALETPALANPAARSWADLGIPVLRNVAQATLTPVLPSPETATGAAVVVAPGGSYLVLAMEPEGWTLARWLADHGIAAFVLEYRLRPTPDDPAAFAQVLWAGDRAFTARGEAALPPFEPAVADARAAVKLVRDRAATWGLDPHRIGFLGFSAGALTALALVQSAEPAERPDFVAPIYPPTAARPLPGHPPPMFLAIAQDDALFGHQGYGLVEAWREAGGSVEFHLYEAGGHGFGFAGRPGTTSVHWTEEFLWWLQARNIIAPP